jgi:aminobenzoyl-glutamate utilization protein B
MEMNKVRGTLRMIGTPAEEGGAGKVYMVRDGVFDDVDAVITWHPGDDNSVTGERSMANISGKFRFHGVSAHAAAAPERGRSAVDGVEAMDAMTNMLREHVPDGTRIHYVITNGGRAPNVVPDEAEVYYYVRHVDMAVVKDVWGRVVNAAKGAAVGTGTTYDLQLTASVYSLLPNEVLAKVQQRSLEQVGGFTYTADERAFAERLQKSDAFTAVPLETTAKVKPLRIGQAGTASVIVTCASFSASANVVAVTSGPTGGAVLNATGAPGVAGWAAGDCVAPPSLSPRHAAAAAARPSGARMRNCRRVFTVRFPSGNPAAAPGCLTPSRSGTRDRAGTRARSSPRRSSRAS